MVSLLPLPPALAASSDEARAEPGSTPQPSAPPDLHVQGIVWGSDRPRAIINDSVYGVGDAVGGSVILLIDSRGVTVDYLGTQIVYPMTSTTSELATKGSFPGHGH